MTRLYFSSSAVPDVMPEVDPAWTRVDSALRRTMSATKDGSVMTGTYNPEWSQLQKTLIRQMVGLPMDAGIAFVVGDTIKCQVRAKETLASYDVNEALLGLKVVSQDGTVLRATLKAVGRHGPTTTEFATVFTNRTFADSDTLDVGYTTVAGDRLVVELGASRTPLAVNTASAGLSLGSDSVTDLPGNEIETAANNPWFEISRTVSFLTIVPPPPPPLGPCNSPI